MLERLVDERLKLVKLFDPPFDKTELDPAGISRISAGRAENGGQYTHAVLWLIQRASSRRGGERRRCGSLISSTPFATRRVPRGSGRTRSRPYVVAADVYSVEPHGRRGGVDVVHRVGGVDVSGGRLESILGLRVRRTVSAIRN